MAAPHQQEVNDTEIFIHNHPPPTLVTIELMLGIFGIVGNGLVCLTVIRARSMHNLTNYLILNLAVADICVCLCLVVFSEKVFLAFSPQGQVAGSIYCILCADKNATWFFTYSAVLALTLVTLERYIAIVYPFHYPRFFTGVKTACYAIICWVIAFLIELPYLFVPKYSLDDKACYYVHLEPVIKGVTALNTAVITFIAPLACMVFSYWRIIRCLRMRAQDLIKEGTQSPAYELLDASKKVVKTLLVVTVIFVITWIPIQTCCSVLSVYPALGSELWFNRLYSDLRTVGYINSVLNVIVYSIKYKQFRKAFKSILCPASWNRVNPVNGEIYDTSKGYTNNTHVS
ncbi:galanin receptor type 2-like [Asterias amurensis]|uniref:galanin receptor type 2-like n=1 Tax=Asterias amurensis TaxID=7602 RepID=UPI003AB27F99